MVKTYQWPYGMDIRRRSRLSSIHPVCLSLNQCQGHGFKARADKMCILNTVQVTLDKASCKCIYLSFVRSFFEFQLIPFPLAFKFELISSILLAASTEIQELEFKRHSPFSSKRSTTLEHKHAHLLCYLHS